MCCFRDELCVNIRGQWPLLPLVSRPVTLTYLTPQCFIKIPCIQVCLHAESSFLSFCVCNSFITSCSSYTIVFCQLRGITPLPLSFHGYRSYPGQVVSSSMLGTVLYIYFIYFIIPPMTVCIVLCSELTLTWERSFRAVLLIRTLMPW